jgi:16S rRNA A1518/A1519 N6-dimethyltransferase RsmA/KsgA/DIM1 with predicted DNA glycosylase/AP lyase activity
VLLLDRDEKMLRASLKSLKLTSENAEALCLKADIDPTARAENLSVSDFVRLSNVFGVSA